MNSGDTSSQRLVDFHRTTLVLRYKGLSYFSGSSALRLQCTAFYFIFYFILVIIFFLSIYLIFFNLTAGYSEAIASFFRLGSW